VLTVLVEGVCFSQQFLVLGAKTKSLQLKSFLHSFWHSSMDETRKFAISFPAESTPSSKHLPEKRLGKFENKLNYNWSR